MNSGCICCTVRGDLIRVIGNLLRRKDKFHAVLIDRHSPPGPPRRPAPVAQTFFVDEDVRERAKLGSIVTIVRRARDRHSIPGARDAGRRPGGGLARLVGSESEPLAAAPYAGGNDRRSIGFSAISPAKSRPGMSHSTPKLS